jgi:hypothetical protein
MYRPLLIAACVGVLGACSGGTPTEAAVESTPSAPQPTVFDDQLKALEKAKAVEQQLQEAKEKADQAIEDQGG